MIERGRHLLMLPGPTNVPERVQRAMLRPADDFAGPAFMAVAESCFADLRRVFATEGEVVMCTTNGHGAWEMALVNLFDPGDALLVPGSGRFSMSWAEMATALGFAVETTPIDWRRAVDPAAVEAALRADRGHRIKGVLLVHTETATGARTDLGAVRRAIDAAGHPALLVVDAIASLAVEPFAMDEAGIDLAIAASQKGLMLPVGLSFLALGAKARAAAERCRYPRRYWDLRSRRGAQSYMWFHGTPPVSHVVGLRAALDMILEEGLPAVVERHDRLARAVRACVAIWSEAGAMELNALVPAERANAVTAIRTDPAIDPQALRTLARERFGVSLGGGLGALEGKAFRIGHLGDLNAPMVLGALGTVEAAMRVSDVPFGKGGLDAAIEALVAAD